MKEEDPQFARKRILIEFINHETDQFDVEQKRHGWSIRALLVALATLVWLLANQMPLTSVNWQSVGLLFFTLVLTIDLIDSFSSMFSMQFGKVSEEPRFFLTSLLGIARIYMLTRLVLCLILFLVGIQLSIHILGISKILILILLAFDAVGSLMGLIVSFRHIPFSKFLIRKGAPPYSFLSTVLMIIALAGYYVALAKNFDSFGPSDIKVAVLLTFIAATFALMGRLPTISPILPSLNSIRQNLVLDKIDVNWATRQVDIALFGMRVGDLFQKDVKEMLDYFDRESKLLRKLTRTLEAAESFIPADPSNLGKDEFSNNREATMALMEDAESYAGQSLSLYEELTKSIHRYSEKDRRIMLMDKRSVGELEGITSKVEMAQSELKSLLTAAEAQILKFKAKIRVDAL